MAIPFEAGGPLSVSRSYRPYYSPLEVDQLSQLQSTSRSQPDLSQHRLHHYRQLACGYIERVGQRIGFPRRTIATAQSLYHRFHLHFPLRDFAYQDVSLAAILVASKLEDTLKKLRDIQIAGYQIANIMEGGTGQSEGDPAAQEAHRPQLIGIERLILQTICFNFTLHKSLTPATSPNGTLANLSSPELLTLASSPTSKDHFSHILRLSALLPLPLEEAKPFTYLAFLLVTDLFRTLAPLSYPPHTCAAACLRLAYFLYSPMREHVEPVLEEREIGLSWSKKCESRDQDLDEIAQTLLNLLISLCPSPPSTSTAMNSFPSSSSFANVSPSFSPAQQQSPSDSGPVATVTPTTGTTTATTSRQTERDRQLLQTGIPNAFSHEVFTWSLVPTTATESSGVGLGGNRGKGKGTGGGNGRIITVDELREIKIRVRESGKERREKQMAADGGGKRNIAESLAENEEGDGEQSSKRWKSLIAQSGLEEVQRLRTEAEEKERYRAEEREEREREKREGPSGFGVTEEERERERELRRERRERMKPGSVRYLF